MDTLIAILQIISSTLALIGGMWIHKWIYDKRAEGLYGYKPKKMKRQYKSLPD